LSLKEKEKIRVNTTLKEAIDHMMHSTAVRDVEKVKDYDGRSQEYLDFIHAWKLHKQFQEEAVREEREEQIRRQRERERIQAINAGLGRRPVVRPLMHRPMLSDSDEDDDDDDEDDEEEYHIRRY